MDKGEMTAFVLKEIEKNHDMDYYKRKMVKETIYKTFDQMEAERQGMLGNLEYYVRGIVTAWNDDYECERSEKTRKKRDGMLREVKKEFNKKQITKR